MVKIKSPRFKYCSKNAQYTNVDIFIFSCKVLKPYKAFKIPILPFTTVLTKVVT